MLDAVLEHGDDACPAPQSAREPRGGAGGLVRLDREQDPGARARARPGPPARGRRARARSRPGSSTTGAGPARRPHSMTSWPARSAAGGERGADRAGADDGDRRPCAEEYAAAAGDGVTVSSAQSRLTANAGLFNNPQMPRLLVLLSAVCFGTTGTAQALGPDAAPVTVGAVRIAVGGAPARCSSRAPCPPRPRAWPRRELGAIAVRDRRLPARVLRRRRPHRRRRRHGRRARLRRPRSPACSGGWSTASR